MKQIGIVLLAAGEGKRFGGNKLEAVVNGKSMYIHAMELIQKEKEFQISVVVTGNENIASAARDRNMKVIWNEHPKLGISHSIQLGIEALLRVKPELEAILFMVCDQPWMKYDTLHDLIMRFDGGIMAVSYEGKAGNPVMFSKKYFHELLELSGDVGGRQVMKRHHEEVYYLEVFNKKELEDVDRREQLEEQEDSKDGKNLL